MVFRRKRRWPRLLVYGVGALFGPLLAFGLTGCASSPLLEAKVRGLEKKLADLSTKNDEALHRQDDLENRVFLLSDQVESQKVAQSRKGAPELPVVALRPQVRHEVVATTEPADDVEFSGPARSENPEKVRPLLRAEGSDVVEMLSPSVLPARPGRRPFTLPRHDAPAAGTGDGLATQTEVADLAGRTLAREARPSMRRRQAALTALTPIAPGGDNLGVIPVPPVPPGQTIAHVVALGRGQSATPPIGPAGPSVGQSAAQPPTSPPVKSSIRGPAADPGQADSTLVRAAGAERGQVASEPLTLYRIAYDRLRAGHFDDAERDLREFVRRFPRHDYADNAQYWLGETFYARKTYGEAATAFRAVVERWPSGNKAPDALLKLGYSLLMLGDKDKGRGVLSQVLDHYPHTDAARLAERRLLELKEGK